MKKELAGLALVALDAMTPTDDCPAIGRQWLGFCSPPHPGRNVMVRALEDTLAMPGALAHPLSALVAFAASMLMRFGAKILRFDKCSDLLPLEAQAGGKPFRKKCKSPPDRIRTVRTASRTARAPKVDSMTDLRKLLAQGPSTKPSKRSASKKPKGRNHRFVRVTPTFPSKIGKHP